MGANHGFVDYCLFGFRTVVRKYVIFVLQNRVQLLGKQNSLSGEADCELTTLHMGKDGLFYSSTWLNMPCLRKTLHRSLPFSGPWPFDPPGARLAKRQSGTFGFHGWDGWKWQ